MGKLIRFILLLPFIPLIYAFSYQALLYFKGLRFEEVAFFLLGLAVYFLLYVMSSKGTLDFLETLEHELTHATASIMLLRMPSKLVVDLESGSRKVGEVKTTTGCFLFFLAPYFLPLFTLPLLLLKPIVPPPFDKFIDFLIGFTLAFHYIRVIKDLRGKQSDITKTGTIFSAVVLVFLNLVFLVIILAVVTGNYSSILEYFKASFERTKEAYEVAYEAIQSVQLPNLEGLFVPKE